MKYRVTPSISFYEFKEDYEDFFFDNFSPEKGLGYIIILKKMKNMNGFISYAELSLVENTVNRYMA